MSDYELTPEQERDLLRFLAGSKSIREVLESSGPDWLIEGWLASSATMVAGSPESGKSSLVAPMAAAVANGGTWLDVPVTTDRTGPVIIITTDPSDSGPWANKARRPQGRR
jgi:AAA domain